VEGDCTNLNHLLEIIKLYDVSKIIHLAANSDIKNGSLNCSLDFEDTLITSIVLSEVLKLQKIDYLFFSSSSAVFGIKDNPISDSPIEMCFPISYYGWAKLASEKILRESARDFGTKFLCFRFPNVVGPNPTHGILYDLKKKLENDNLTLEVLGNGSQTKPYLHIDDLVDIFFLFWQSIEAGTYNVGPNDLITVKEIVDIICSSLGISPNLIWGLTNQGWKGDVPNYSFQSNLVKSKISYEVPSSRFAIQKAVNQIWDL
jgi:UDP-glucose 4-epimerase